MAYPEWSQGPITLELFMKKSGMVSLGIGACALACAGAAVLPLIVGASVIGAGGAGALFAGASLKEIICAVALAGAGAGGTFAFMRNRKAATQTCSVDQPCACGAKNRPGFNSQ
jgi:hypothetical protein